MIFFYVKYIQPSANVFSEYKECLRLRLVRGRILPKTSLFLCAISSVNPLTYIITMICYTSVNPLTYIITMICYTSVNPLTYIITMICYKYRNNALVITFIYKDENKQLTNRMRIDSALYIVNKHIVYR
jgi:hypothetical protein